MGLLDNPTQPNSLLVFFSMKILPRIILQLMMTESKQCPAWKLRRLGKSSKILPKALGPYHLTCMVPSILAINGRFYTSHWPKSSIGISGESSKGVAKRLSHSIIVVAGLGRSWDGFMKAFDHEQVNVTDTSKTADKTSSSKCDFTAFCPYALKSQNAMFSSAASISS